MPVFNIQLVALLALVFAGGAWLGWLLRREQAEQVHDSKFERRTEQLDAQCATIERVTRERDEMRERHQESQAVVHRHKRQLQSLREAVDELSTDKRRLLRTKDKLIDAHKNAVRDNRKLDRQLKLLIKRTAAERLERSKDSGRRRRATDELQQIRGIGPALAAKLRDFGVDKLTDIAQMDELAVARLDKQLTFRGRIRRDQWIEQAQALLTSDDSVSA
ncbi:MAG: helix-hairpin-helix domain-containing protein [Pseudomonadota bacterium]